MKSNFIKVFMLCSLVFSVNAFADSRINWYQPENYTDIEAGEENRMKFQQRFFASIEKHFDMLAKSLPEGQKLLIKVTDVDLAGRVLPSTSYGGSFPRNYRIVKHYYYPELRFEYRLLDASGEVLRAESINLKDLGFLDKVNTQKTRRQAFPHEKNMITNWYKKTFPSK